MKAVQVLIIVSLFLFPVNIHAFSLTVVHVNDSHSHLEPTPDSLILNGRKTYVKMGGWGNLKTKVDAIRAQYCNVALLHAGDAVQGTLYFTKYLGRPELELMNLLGFDAMVLGNHEFDKGPKVLTEFLQYARFPVLSANMVGESTHPLHSLVRSFTILEFNGERVGVIGLTTTDTASISSPEPISFADEVKTAQKCVEELQSRGINKIIALTHMGFEQDKKLAAAVAGIDIIVGGHSQTLLDTGKNFVALGKRPVGKYPTVVQGLDGSKVFIVAGWECSKGVGVLQATFNKAGQILHCQGNVVLLLADSFKRRDATGKKVELEGEERNKVMDLVVANPNVEIVGPDADAAALLAPYAKGIEAMGGEIIGESMQPLVHIRIPGVSETGQQLPHGSQVAPLVCEAMLWKVNSLGFKVDMALHNAGGVRGNIDSGPITVGDVHSVLPFSDTLFILELRGAQILAMLEQAVARGSGAFPYLSGVHYTVDMNKPAGSRISGLFLQQDQGRVVLDPGASYRIVTYGYLARGGDGYAVLEKSKGYRYDTGFLDAEVLMEYLWLKTPLWFDNTLNIKYIPAQ